MRTVEGLASTLNAKGGQSTFKERTGSVSQKGPVADIHGGPGAGIWNTRTFSGGLRCFGKLQSPLRRPVLLPRAAAAPVKRIRFSRGPPPPKLVIIYNFFSGSSISPFHPSSLLTRQSICANAKFNYRGSCGFL